MRQSTIRICHDNHAWQAELNPAGTIIGRSNKCDIVIDSRHVSRQHARVFSTSDGKWFVEDLGSSNGTFVNGQRIKTCSISQADVIEIGLTSLSFNPFVEQATLPCVEAPNIIIEDFGTEVFYDKPRLEDCQQDPCPKRLKEVSQCLLEPAQMEALYPKVCRLLTQNPKTAAAIFRVHKTTVSTYATPGVMACSFGSIPEDGKVGSVAINFPSHIAFRVSHRLLEAVRKDACPLMTKSIFSCDTRITLSLIDEQSPRAIICAPIRSTSQTIDLLYVDVPINERRQPSAEEMFAFVQAVAQFISKRNSA